MTDTHIPTEAGPSTGTPPEPLLQLARDRSARGNATRRDWERVAAVDPALAHRELAEFLRRHGNAVHGHANPYERSARVPGALLGFIGGVLAVAAIWLILPWIRDTYISTPIWQHVITSGQYIFTVLIPAGIVIGARWGAAHDAASPATRAGLPPDASFEEMLAAFEQTQHIGRARVY